MHGPPRAPREPRRGARPPPRGSRPPTRQPPRCRAEIALRRRCSRLLHQLLDLAPRARIHNLISPQPAPAGLRDPEAHVLELVQAMRVGGDDEHDSRLARYPRVVVGEIEAIRLRVDLEEGAGFE